LSTRASVQVAGSFAAATIVFEGSNDGAVWFAIGKSRFSIC
jgi:hypothetical protein